MENIILGLLLLQPRTIYQLRKRINDGLNLMYSSSTGSIQAAIKKLLGSGDISSAEIIENGKVKKLYSITSEGEKRFHMWTNSPIESGTSKNPELVKIYFMGFAEKENRGNVLSEHIANLRKIYESLEEICKAGADMAEELEENDTLFYQLQTANYGRDLMNFNINWYTALLEKTKERQK